MDQPSPLLLSSFPLCSLLLCSCPPLLGAMSSLVPPPPPPHTQTPSQTQPTLTLQLCCDAGVAAALGGGEVSTCTVALDTASVDGRARWVKMAPCGRLLLALL